MRGQSSVYNTVYYSQYNKQYILEKKQCWVVLSHDWIK